MYLEHHWTSKRCPPVTATQGKKAYVNHKFSSYSRYKTVRKSQIVFPYCLTSTNPLSDVNCSLCMDKKLFSCQHLDMEKTTFPEQSVGCPEKEPHRKLEISTKHNFPQQCIGNNEACQSFHGQRIFYLILQLPFLKIDGTI